MKRYMTVRVVDAGGKPAHDARVTLWVKQLLASGPLPEKRTNREGLAEFEADLDEGAKVLVSVNGRERTPYEAPQAQYRVTL
jgi:hypothetical protein